MRFALLAALLAASVVAADEGKVDAKDEVPSSPTASLLLNLETRASFLLAFRKLAGSHLQDRCPELPDLCSRPTCNLP